MSDIFYDEKDTKKFNISVEEADVSSCYACYLYRAITESISTELVKCQETIEVTRQNLNKTFRIQSFSSSK